MTKKHSEPPNLEARVMVGAHKPPFVEGEDVGLSKGTEPAALALVESRTDPPRPLL